MKSDGHPFVFKGKRYIAYEVIEQVEEDCDCRYCKPELWFLDTDRDVWIKKGLTNK